MVVSKCEPEGAAQRPASGFVVTLRVVSDSSRHPAISSAKPELESTLAGICTSTRLPLKMLVLGMASNRMVNCQ